MAFSLIAKFGLDATGLRTELNKLRGEVTDFADKWAKIGLAAGAAAFTALAKGALDLAANLRDTALALGINVESLQALHYSAEQNGASQEQMTKALEKLRIGLQRAKEGSQTHAEALSKLGLNMEKISKLPLERQFEALAVAYAKSGDKGAAYNAVTELLGDKIGPKLVATLQDMAGSGFDAVAKSAADAGHVMSAETVVALEKADQAIQDFKKRATIAVGNILVNFDSAEGLKLMGMQLMKQASNFGTRLLDAVIDVALMAKNTFDAAFTWVTAKFQNGLVNTLQAVSGLVNKILPDKFKIDIGNLESLKVATDDFGLTITKAIANSTPSKLTEELGGWWDGAIKQQQGVVDALRSVAHGKDAEPLKAKLQEGLTQGANEAAQELKTAIAEGGEIAAEEIKEAVDDIQEAAAAFGGIRTGAHFSGASTAALEALVRSKTVERERALQAGAMAPAGSVNGAVRWINQMIAAAAGQEIQNAQRELDMRARIQRSFAAGGESAVYRAFPQMDPLKLDKLIDQFGRNLTESERTANTIEGIARGLARNKIIPPL